jgi:ubiquitin-activating enzyme E1 C
MLIGTDGVYSYTFEYEKRADCPVCGGEAIDLAISPDLVVEDLINMLVEKQDMCVQWYFLLLRCLTDVFFL